MSSEFFIHDAYQRHNRRRQEHLASLMLPLAGKTILELGAGIGDHTSFFLDRNCTVTVTDVREENLVHVHKRFPLVGTRIFDIEGTSTPDLPSHEIVYAYGLLYHLADPASALIRMSSLAKEMLLLETCVSFGTNEAINQVPEDVTDPTQAAHGMGCRPTRLWVFNSLSRLFDYVYVPRTQPWHEEFPTDWLAPPPANTTGLFRSVFIASRTPLDSPMLANSLLNVQTKQ